MLAIPLSTVTITFGCALPLVGQFQALTRNHIQSDWYQKINIRTHLTQAFTATAVAVAPSAS